jgi:hypothetical protein
MKQPVFSFILETCDRLSVEYEKGKIQYCRKTDPNDIREQEI